MKTFRQWLKEDAPANSTGGGIAEMPLPLGGIIRRKPKKDGIERTDRTGTKHPSRIPTPR